MIETVSHYRSGMGMEVARREFAPAAPLALRGGVVLMHGIGEHTARYGEVMRRLTGMGLVCAGVDWPGHGRSRGKRGHIDSLESVHTLVRETRAHLCGRLAAAGGVLTMGLVAHSMGGLFALDFLGRFHGDFQFAWVNAPPLDPVGKRSRAYLGIARRLEALFPRLTIHNGVDYARCFDASNAELVAEARRNCHTRVSLRLGLTLMETAGRVRESAREFEESLALLLTQGGADAVCPPAQTRAWFEALDLAGKTYREFPGLLHECWRDAEVVDAAVDWIGRRLQG